VQFAFRFTLSWLCVCVCVMASLSTDVHHCVRMDGIALSASHRPYDRSDSGARLLQPPGVSGVSGNLGSPQKAAYVPSRTRVISFLCFRTHQTCVHLDMCCLHAYTHTHTHTYHTLRTTHANYAHTLTHTIRTKNTHTNITNTTNIHTHAHTTNNTFVVVIIAYVVGVVGFFVLLFPLTSPSLYGLA
jgi:hypothetical protein